MQRALRGRLLLLAGVLLWAVWWLVPTLRAGVIDPEVRAANLARWRLEDEEDSSVGGTDLLTRVAERWWGGERAITLGLDLRGGMHLAMEVDSAAAVANELSRLKREVDNRARDDDLLIDTRTVPDDLAVLITCEPKDNAKVKALLGDLRRDTTVSAMDGGFRLVLSREVADRQADLAVRQALETIRNRIDEFGVAEPVLQRQGTDRLLIQLPGVRDPARVLSLIGRTAVLEFSEVFAEARTEAELRRQSKYRIPLNRVIRHGTSVDSFGVEQETYYLLDKDPILTGADLRDARVGQGQFGDYAVNFQLDARAGRRFARWTSDHIGTAMAIILDGEVQSAPVIRDRIRDSGQITGDFLLQEAEDLAIVLRAGALPAPVHIIEQRTIGPTLGRDSIRSGVRAAAIGFGLVLVFMVVYYRLSGVIAVGALVINVVLVLAALAAFRATLTLPGIAGLILTMGMAVDANVLIFERIREELGKGKTLRSAVDAAFERVTLTILDANITTLITALVLFQFGTGPVKGFAVTLSVGIVASMYTALVGTRMALDGLLYGRDVRKLTLSHIIGETHVPFIAARRMSLVASAVLLLVGLGWFYQRGPANFGIDFTQGTLVQAQLTPPADVSAVRRMLLAGGIEQPTVQELGDPGGMLIRTGFVGTTTAGGAATLTGQKVEQILVAGFGASAVEILRTEEVGAAVSGDLTRQAVLALLYSMGAIVIYISFRFEFRFAIAAVVALIHDVAITVGLFALTGREISLPVVAALLTVVGYSLNDTIVVFDRIRENRMVLRGLAYGDMLNTSINDMLSRTILTSLTTLFVVGVLYLFGGPVIHDFAFALLVGVAVGTYSSMFVASPILLAWQTLRPQGWRERAGARGGAR